jgi:hypothetical protein
MLAFYSVIYYHVHLQGPPLCDDGVAPTSQIRVTAMLEISFSFSFLFPANVPGQK